MRWFAVALGAALGVALALSRTSVREGKRAPEPAPTNAVEQVAATNKANAATNSAPEKTKKIFAQKVTLPSATNAVSVAKKPPRKPVTSDPKIPKNRQVLLANRRIAIASGRSFPKKFCAAQTPTSRGTAPYVVISELPVSRDVRIQAVADGAKVIGFLPNNALLVEADAAALKNLEEDVLFTAAVEYEPSDKIQRALLDGEKGERGETGERGESGESGETVEANVVLLNEKDVAVIRDFITANGGSTLHGAPKGGKSICATMPSRLVTELAGKAEVKWIERYSRMKPHNDVAVQPGLMNVTPVREAPLGLTGAGQIITTSDTGIDTGDSATLHADLKSAVIGMRRTFRYCNSTDKSGHGTHTAGSLVGDGTLSDGKIRGAAPGAKLWAWFCEDSSGYLYFPEYYDWDLRDYRIDSDLLFRPTRYAPQLADAHVHSASWGGGSYGYYSAQYCWPVDDFVWLNPDFLPVFAAGNDGMGAMTVTEPATAKNVLAVGASENLRPTMKEESEKWYAENPARLASFSSCGPCEDGRVKPDIVAPGTYVLSCLSTKASRCDWDDGSYANYQFMGGTSMATPLTAGTAALVREWLARYREKANPSAALVKAIMLGGATDLFYESGSNVLKSVPDTRQGWGRVDLAGTVAPTNGLATFLADWLPFAATSNFTFRVTTTNAAPLNVQLVWVDYPGEAEAAKMLVNNLDLRVTAGTQKWLGNGGSEPDELNNAESVRIREAAAATYTVRVQCPTVPYDHTQGGAAAVYIRGAFDPDDVACVDGVGTIWTIR